MQLEQAREGFFKKGLAVAAISYDSPSVLLNFANRSAIHYPLLADQGSAVIRAFGLLNTQLPENNQFYGVPHPGMYLVDGQGKITAKYFEREYQERFTPETVLSKSFGIGGGSQVEVKAQNLTLRTYLSRDHVCPGNRVSLVAEITLPSKMHLYAPGVQGYRPVALFIEEAPGLKIHDAEYPKAQKLFLPVIKEEVPVYERGIRITRDVTIMASTRSQKIEIKGVLEYQACDDKVCYLPDKIPITFNLEVEPQDRIRVPEEIRKKAP